MIRILVVEDDSVSRKVLRLFLQPFGDVIAASRADDGIGAFFAAYHEEKPFELVLLDIGLPDRDGIEVLAEMRNFERKMNFHTQTPVIMLTGDASATHIRQAQDLGASKYLLKPVIESELLEQLASAGISP